MIKPFLYKMKNVCFILPFFGKVVLWNSLFFESIALNTNYNWLIFSDITFNDPLPENIRLIYMQLDQFNLLLSNKLGFKINIIHPYKICDFKPTFGYIFSDYLADFKYWGYCDLDLVFGDLDAFLREPLQIGYDFISPEEGFFPGHFCICKNQDLINKLFFRIENYKEILSNQKCYCFDEFLVPRGFDLNAYSLEKRIKRNVRKNKLKHLLKQTIAFKVLHSYYRIHKKNTPYRVDSFKDFNRIIEYYTQKKTFITLKKQLCDSDTRRFRLGFKNWKVIWKSGKLYNNEGKEILYFHFPLSKYNKSLYIEKTYTGTINSFTISGSF